MSWTFLSRFFKTFLLLFFHRSSFRTSAPFVFFRGIFEECCTYYGLFSPPRPHLSRTLVKVSALATRTPVKTARARRRCEAFSIPHEQFWWLFSLSSPPVALGRNRISTKDSSELTQKDLLIATNRNGLHSKFLVLLVESILPESIIIGKWVSLKSYNLYLPTNLIHKWKYIT